MKLYHYTKSDILIKHILPDMELKMNYLVNMNDPKENLIHIVDYDELIGSNIERNNSNLDQVYLANQIRTETQILAFSVDYIYNNLEYRVEIEGFQLQRMWASYGQNNEGVCLEIDIDRFKKENRETLEEYNIIDSKVLYDNFLYQGLPYQIYGQAASDNTKLKSKSNTEFWHSLQMEDKFIKDRFFTKNIDWNGESEYRFLAFSQDTDRILLSIKMSLCKIILGINFSKYFLPSVRELVSDELIYIISPSDSGNFEINRA